MGIQLRKPLFCLFQYLPERNIWFIHCLLGGKLSPKVTDEGAILYPTFPCRRRDLSPFRPASPAPLGESIAPSSAPVCALGHLPPEGKALGVGNPPVGYPNPLPSNGLARQGTPSRSGRQPAKNPKGPTHLSAQRTRPVGHASQSSAGRSRRKRIQSCFDRLRRPKHTSHPESAGFAGAGRGAIPQFWEGPQAKQNPHRPRTLPSRTKHKPLLPLPKFYL